MHNLALAQELDGVAHIRIIRKAQDVVIRYAGLLLGGEVFVDVASVSPVTAMLAALNGAPEAAAG